MTPPSQVDLVRELQQLKETVRLVTLCSVLQIGTVRGPTMQSTALKSPSEDIEKILEAI